MRESWGGAASGREAQLCYICLPLPWLQPQLSPPSLSLTLNLLYNFKIKFFKKQERESTEGKIPPTISLQGGEKFLLMLKKKKECKGSLKSLSTK